MAAQGLYPDAPKPPCVVGYEVAGVIDALGDGTHGHATGQRVLALTHFGGHADVTLRRIAKWGDGWMMLAYPAGDQAKLEFAKLRAYVEQAGRDPSAVGIEVWVSTAQGGPTEWREELAHWKAAGVTHVTLNSAYGRPPHRRIAGKTMRDHLEAMKQYHAAVADLL